MFIQTDLDLILRKYLNVSLCLSSPLALIIYLSLSLINANTPSLILFYLII